jgi:hypothetical protein
MRIGNRSIVTAALLMTLTCTPMVGWATRAVGTMITGPITASPSSARIEIAHHAYAIQINSPAAKSANTFYLGQLVDVTLSRPAANGQSEVVAIALHHASGDAT